MQTDITNISETPEEKKCCCSNTKSFLFIKFLIVFIVASSIGIYFRLYPLRNYSPGDFREKATMLVLHHLKETVRNNVNASHSNLSPQEKNLLINTQLNKLLHKEKANVRQSIKSLTENFSKQSLQERSSPYLLASDSFYYYALTQNIQETGKIANEIKGSKYLNPLMLAPNGHYEPLNMHPYVGLYIYKIMKLFNPDVDLMHAVSYTPLVIATLAVIPFLIICYSLGINAVCSLVGSIFFLLAPIFIKRSTFGWYDNDPYNTLFPLLILSSIFLGLSKISAKKNLLYGLLSAFLLLVYAFFWQGWVLLFFVIFSSAIIILLHNRFVLKDTDKTKNTLSLFGVFSAGSFFAITLVFGVGEFFTLFKEGWIALKNFLTPQLSLWPDLYISVSELHKATMSYIVEYSGGKFFMTIACIGLIASLVNIPRQKDIANIPKTFIITIFLSISLIISSGAQRFVMLVFVPLSIFFAIGIQSIYNFLCFLLKHIKNSDNTSRSIHPGILAAKVLLIISVLAVSILPIHSVNKSIESLLNPIFNETWENTLTKIKNETPANSIVTTWWPPGHFIKAIAKRSVTFDGATINVPQAYWVSNIFLSQDEEKAIGLIRMLNNSGNNAADYLVKDLGFDLSTSTALLKLISGLPPVKAAIALGRILKNTDSVNHILSLTHKTPPSSYILLYNEFVENNLQLKFIGKWNFKELEKINKDPALLEQVPDRSSPEYVQFLWNLVGGAYKYSGILNQLDNNKQRVIFDHNVTIDLQTKSCTVESPKYGKGIPLSVIHAENGFIEEVPQPNANLSYSVLLYKDRDSYKSVLLDRPLAKSLLVNLYFFEGKGLKYFKPFSKESDLTGRTRILVFEVDWESFNRDTKISYQSNL